MVGSGTKRVTNGNVLHFNVVFKSNYPNSTAIDNSLVTGTLESLDSEGNEGYFKPVSIMSFAKMNYAYSLIKDEVKGDDNDNNIDKSLVYGGRKFGNCYQFASLEENFNLEYRSDCDGRNCTLIDGILGFLPKFMSLNEIDCSGPRMVRVSFGFSNISDIRNGFRQPLDPTRTLVAEGVWNVGKGQLFFAACRILNFSKDPLNATIGDCSVRVNFTFADTLSIRDSGVVNGHIWSIKGVDEPDYFDTIEIRASGSRRAALPDMKYKYTEIERAKKFCAEKKGSKQKGKSYPDPYSQDMKFDMELRNSKGKRAWGKANPVFVGDRFVQDIYPYFRSRLVPNPNSAVNNNNSYHGLLNVAYRLAFSPKDEFKVGGRSFTANETIRISAEGIYDTDAGRLCMVGCWNLKNDGKATLNTSKLDCDTFVNIQFPPRDLNVKDVVKGTIESKRANSDPLHFDRLDFSATSLTKFEVKSAFWRMDLEIAMVLVSNTLACVFVGLQLIHVKRNPNALPFISVVMLVVITLGHLIPLLLNMEAFFLSSPSKRTVLFGSGGWLEVNEVLVRVITMVAFLLEFRLLQLTWSTRGSDEDSHKTLWESEKRVICYTLPLYVLGALVAWLVQLLRAPQRVQFQHIPINSNPTLPFWRDMKSYAGFILDAFLLPQIVFNVFSDSKERALSVPYYLGTTAVRLLPHGYDLFRAHSSSWSFDPWYIYADPRMNYYSTAWDILVSCLGLLFVVLIFLQQWLGGRWVLPRRFSKTFQYEKVPVGL